ncbi:MAG: PQQ-dependent dehydrogenase, methanol/ethanol family [Acidobacteriia bacterium]|nr:PQQ-dependent dehydrogenase, methanol/ethanol family [Terriglobia bacterium]
MRHALLLVLASSAIWGQPGVTRENWPHYGGTYQSLRHSALNQINASNVKKLTPVWTFQTGDTDGGLQSTPLVIDGVMYISTAHNWVYAVNAATGRQIWKYTYPLPKGFTIFYGPHSRGVAIGHGMVYMGTLDNHVVAIDQKTGREVWNVTVEDSTQCGCNITAAPLLVKDKVMVGVTGGDSAHRGYINAFDARSGRKLWQFWTIPGPGEKGNETWSGDSWKYGGGSTWMTGSYDAELNLTYWSVGNPAADFYGASRMGDNLYTDSVVALDVDTGKLKWYFQQIPHDVWDFDTAYENILLDLPVNGTPRKLLLNVNKGGFTFVNDRVTGEFVAGYPIVKNITWIKGVDAKGKLVGRNEPEVGKSKTLCPSIGGGRSWNQASYSPRTKWLYTTAIEWCQDVTSVPEEPKEGQVFFGGVFQVVHPKDGPAHGHLDALDPITGKVHWSYKSKYPLLASVLSTDGGLVFSGDPEGDFFALDAKSGQRLWSYQTGSGHRGSSVAYAVNGRQFVATPSGWGSAVMGLINSLWPETERFQGGSAVHAFALPEEGR